MNIFSLLIFLFVVLVVLKLTGLIAIGWLAVFVPVFIWLGLIAFLILLGVIAVGAGHGRFR